MKDLRSQRAKLSKLVKNSDQEPLQNVRPYLLRCLNTPELAAQAALLLWKSRREGTPLEKEHREFLFQARNHPNPTSHFYLLSTLLLDSKPDDNEHPRLITEIRNAQIPESFVSDSHHHIFSNIVCCIHSSRYKKPDKGDNSTPKHTGTSCHICGNTKPRTVYHHIYFYSIGIIEDHDVHCSLCGFVTRHGFET